MLYVESSNEELLKSSSDKVLAMMKTVPDLTNVVSDLSDAREQLAVDVDEQKAADNGMTQVSIGQAVARAVRGQQIGTLAQGDTTLNVYLRSQTPVKSLAELREIKLPVTQAMNGNAKSDAADKVTARSDKLQADAKESATDAYNDQVKALKKSKASAQKAVKTLTSQINKAKRQLSSLQKQLAAIPAKCHPADPTDPDCCSGADRHLQALPADLGRRITDRLAQRGTRPDQGRRDRCRQAARRRAGGSHQVPGSAGQAAVDRRCRQGRG